MQNNLLACAAILCLSAGTSHAVNVIPLFDFGGRAGFHMRGERTDAWLGLPVEGVGDFNGDGIDDFLVVAENGNPGSGSATYVIFGRTTPFPQNLDLASLDGSNGMRIDSIVGVENQSDSSGAGDFNHDGYADVIVGTTDINVGRGRACVVFGGPSHPPALALASINGSNGTCYYGITEYDRVGHLVARAGDLNADGIDDIAMGSTMLDGQAVDDGGLYVVFGRSGAFPAGQSLSAIDGNNGFLFHGKNPGDRVGISAALIGDLNGDGNDDFAVGSETEQSNRGAAFVLFGRATPWTATVSTSSVDGTIGFRVLGPGPNVFLGRGVGGLDFDGDGIDDLVVGSIAGGPNRTGSASVVYGRTGGFPPVLDIATLDGTNGRSFHGTSTFERLGEQAANAGDVNGDGVDDLLLAAPFADYTGSDSGSVYIVFGSRQRGPVELFSSAIAGRVGFRMDGFDPDGYCGQRQRPVGDINDDGIDDLVIGCNYSSGGGVHLGAAHALLGNAAPLARLPSAVMASANAGGSAVVIALAAVATAQYLDAQPFAGAAITSTPASVLGSWAYRQSGASAFQPIPSGLSTSNALVLAPGAELSFTPIADSVGQAGVPLRFWDGSGSYTPGLRNIDGDIGSLGGFANDANEFLAKVQVHVELFADGFE